MGGQKKSKNQLRRERQKQKKLIEEDPVKEVKKAADEAKKETKSLLDDVDTLIASEVKSDQKESGKLFESDLDRVLETPEFAQFKHVFDRFHTEQVIKEDESKGDIIESDDEEEKQKELLQDSGGEGKGNAPELSKKKQRKASRIPLAQLKAQAKHPELVHWYDVDAADPKLVVSIKSHKNYVPVPAHWQNKREYLSGRRGAEKKAFTLPKYIAETGITDMRDTTKEDERSLKQISREKVQPKMNRLDMDYQKLYDSFFKFQTKPRLFEFGDVYYEGREADELDTSQFRPGVISQELRDALGIPKGVSLPWVVKMKQFGPPPSYPDLLIPGYNTDIEQEAVNVNDVGFNNEEPFGKLLTYEESSEEEEDEEIEEEEEEEIQEEEAAALLAQEDIQAFLPTAESLKQKDDKTIEEIAPQYEVSESEEAEGEDVPLANVSFSNKEQQEDIEPKKLYQILKEKVQAEKGFLSSGKSYDMSTDNKRKSPEESEQPQKRAKKETTDAQKKKSEYEEDEEDEEGGKFKF